MTLLKCLLILVQCKTYFHMHYVSMQPNKKKKKKKGFSHAFAGTLPHCIRESQHLQTVFSLHEYLCN